MNIYHSAGICIGASSVSVVYLKKYNNSFSIDSNVIPHNGNPKKVITAIFQNGLPSRVITTGKKFRGLVNLPSISEAEAVEYAFEYLDLKADMIISAGGENFIIYLLDGQKKISKVITGNKCASGTGEFFLQQIKRMNLNPEEAVELGLQGDPYKISGRCSVFCKSDCTHALNKGVSKASVTAGLSKMIAQKVVELTAKIPHKKAVIIGGVAQNRAMMKYLHESLSNLSVPDEAPYFEALGAAIQAANLPGTDFNPGEIFSERHSGFPFHNPLSNYISMVHFKEMKRDRAEPMDECMIGLDVGSTTTKAILLREKDSAILASEYLRTNGDPVKASVECYISLKKQITVPIRISGLGVTGSGRHIAGLHALTKAVINEIIAHASATVYFDKDVDTIFEIGGQDAKYTYITSGIASDYAMNEACSAGTGSFLEEAAKESLDIDYKEIGEIAMRADKPPDFNDQCAAFISSDIKNALHEGLSRDNIVAGLVYSICMNYSNRVKGNRPVGKKVFMQGGVCYNKAVPVAMAAITGKEIIVPPEPGLMGAFGVALEVKNRIKLGLLQKQEFNLDELINRTVDYDKEFICAGGAEKCDRKCSISLIRIDQKKYPFGGACNKYYNLQSEKIHTEVDLVKLRQDLVYNKYLIHQDIPEDAPTIGISKSFLSNTLFPLYFNFFTQLGFKVITGDEPLQEGVDKKEAAFCYPAELAHGFLQDLINKQPDYILLPHIKQMFNPDENHQKKTCVLLQSESYYLQSVFKAELKGIKLLTPVVDFSNGYFSSKKEFIDIAKSINADKHLASSAFDLAYESLQNMFSKFKRLGKEFLEKLESDPGKFAVVLFGRAYNAFAGEANLGIPQKFSTRGISIIPHDFLPVENLKSYDHMYWALGQQILKSARFVKQHKQLFGTFVTNFSCGPDSFIISYFRTIMGDKPSLTLELDSHSADAGINTRIEAALDIIRSYRELYPEGKQERQSTFVPLKIRNSHEIVDSDGNTSLITDPQVKMLIPSMGRIGTELLSAAFHASGLNTVPLPVYDSNVLKKGRGCSSCKECLPLILNAGVLIDYYEQRKDPDEKTILFMAKGDGPCRLGQYHVYLQDLINSKEMKNVGLYTLTDEDAYGGLGTDFLIRGWTAVVISDVLKDIYFALQVLADDRASAMDLFEKEKDSIKNILERKSSLPEIYKQLRLTASVLNSIPKKQNLKDAKKISLIGEIFVRHDEFSKMDLVEKLIDNEFIIKLAPVSEYVYYSNYLIDLENKLGLQKKFEKVIKDLKQKSIEKKIKNILAQSGLYESHLIDIRETIKKAGYFVKPDLAGEAILTIGSALDEIIDRVCGVIAVGPFGCMPSRVAESILNTEMNIKGKETAEQKDLKLNAEIEDLPFLAIETDGNLFPQIIQSRIEIFMLQAQRMHEKLSAGYSPLDKYRDAYSNIINELKSKHTTKPQEEILPDITDVISETD